MKVAFTQVRLGELFVTEQVLYVKMTPRTAVRLMDQSIKITFKAQQIVTV